MSGHTFEGSYRRPCKSCRGTGKVRVYVDEKLDRPKWNGTEITAPESFETKLIECSICCGRGELF